MHTFTEAGTAQYGTNGSVTPLRPELTTSMMIHDSGGTTGDAAADTGYGDFMAGTEVFGATTVNLGPHWTVTGETFDLTAGGATDTDLLPSDSFHLHIC